jgi:hypothetical protein
MLENKEFEILSLLYQENAKVAAIFWEWRHKVMVSFFAGIAALFALAGWFYQQTELRGLLRPALFIGSILSLVSFFLDRRNANILRDCYRVGKVVESKLTKDVAIAGGAIFESIGKSHYTILTYTLTLGAVYVIVGIVLLALVFTIQLFI